MENYEFNLNATKTLPIRETIKVGVAGSGNLEITVRAIHKKKACFIIHTTVAGFKPTWKAVITRFVEEYPISNLCYTIHDAGASPAMVSLRLRQAIETYQMGYSKAKTYTEMSARERIYSLLDKRVFQEFLLDEDCNSINLPALGIQTQTDDGVVIGVGQLAGQKIAIAAQQKDFIGGSVGEIHGAKLIGLIRYAIKHQLEGIIFLIDSGGVRLQEANVGEIEISEMIHALLDARAKGIKTIGVIAGENGAYGGMGIFSGALDYRIVNQVARIGVSGADVIQAVKGKEAFNASDRPLMWRVYGGRTRFIQKAAEAYTSNQIHDIKQAIVTAFTQLNGEHLLAPEQVQKNHQLLKSRLNSAKNCVEEGAWLAATYANQYANLFELDDARFLSAVVKMEQ